MTARTFNIATQPLRFKSFSSNGERNVSRVQTIDLEQLSSQPISGKDTLARDEGGKTASTQRTAVLNLIFKCAEEHKLLYSLWFPHCPTCRVMISRGMIGRKDSTTKPTQVHDCGRTLFSGATAPLRCCWLLGSCRGVDEDRSILPRPFQLFAIRSLAHQLWSLSGTATRPR